LQSPSQAGAARYVGSRVHRVEDERLLTGHGTFVADVMLSGTLHGCFVRSPHARARIVAVDTSAAAALPGVWAVFLAADLNPGVRAQWHTLSGPEAVEAPRPPLADIEVRFVGDPVAFVVADDAYIAEDAAELVVVEYDPLPPVVDYVDAESAEGLVHADFPNNVIGTVDGQPADEVEAAFAGAAHVVSETIVQHAYVPSPMETRGMVAHRHSGELTI
jgi:carbon-monoxide dehydrogenase large subunit